jgi:micrococcal nuclease
MLAIFAAALAWHATVLKVVDGDTLRISVRGWPAPFTPIDVRVVGVDAPEHVRPPAQAQCEVALGLKAQAYARGLVAPGQAVTVTWSGHHEKYGRLLARVTLPDGRDWGQAMVAAGLARAYGADGSLHKQPWCEDAADPSAGR